MTVPQTNSAFLVSHGISSVVRFDSEDSYTYYEIDENVGRLIDFKCFNATGVQSPKESLKDYIAGGATLLCTDTRSVFVPSELFNSELLERYLSCNSKIGEGDAFGFDDVSDRGIVGVYAFSKTLKDYNCKNISHYSSRLLRLIFKSLSSERTAYARFFIDIESDFYRIFVVDRDKLILYNSFCFDGKEEFVYYILFTLDQLGINPLEQTIYTLTNFVGDIVVGEEFLIHLKSHVRSVFPWSIRRELSLDFALKEKIRQSKVLLV